jgi:hypothetical protein
VSTDPNITQIKSDAQAVQAELTSLQTQVASLTTQLAAAKNVSQSLGLEWTPWLLSPGTTANSANVGSCTTATQFQPGAGLAGFSTVPAGPFANAYWYKTLGADPTKNAYRYEARFMLPTPVAPQAIEMDIQQVISGLVFNPGCQFDFADNAIRIWDRVAKSWVSTGLQCPRWSVAEWRYVVLEAHRDAANIYYDAITMNSVRTPLTQSFPAPNLGLSDMLNCAIQQDGNEAQTPYILYISGVNFTASQV